MSEMRIPNSSAPWLDTSIPTHIRLLGYVAIAILLGILFLSAIVLAAAVFGSLLAGSLPRELDFVVMKIALPIFGLMFGIYGWGRVRRYAFGADDFRPQISVLPKELGQPIEVLISKPIRGIGGIQFKPDRIKFHGEFQPGVEPGPNGEGLAGALIFLIFGFIVYLILKRKVSVEIEYEEISDINLEGRKVSIVYFDDRQQELRFMVSPHDGERLYRELKKNYPSAISKWRHLLI